MGKTGGGFITAGCARFFPDGRLLVANAGHLSPYLDGKELPVEPGLPLGIVADGTYGESTFATSGRTVTWLSDGVLEAQSPSGELLGFERMAALTVKPVAEIAEAVRATVGESHGEGVFDRKLLKKLILSQLASSGL
jgi:sigma-B regulation protein RsbU (phosphoserine phosphatase)